MLHYDTDALHSRILGMLELELGLAKQNREWHQRSHPMDIQGSWVERLKRSLRRRGS